MDGDGIGRCVVGVGRGWKSLPANIVARYCAGAVVSGELGRERMWRGGEKFTFRFMDLAVPKRGRFEQDQKL